MPAEFFGVILCRFTGVARRVFNPDQDWEFAHHHIDSEVEYLHYERKEDWGVPLEPNAMTLAHVARIQDHFDNRRNWRPGDDEAAA
jgi:hypothetical protein